MATYKITSAYRCNDDSSVGWAVELDDKFFATGSTWGEAKANALYAASDENGDEGSHKIIVPRAIRKAIREEVSHHGAELFFTI